MIPAKRSYLHWTALITFSISLVMIALVPAGPTLAQSPKAANARLDLTGNRLVNDADASSMIESWQSRNEMGPCHQVQVNADRDVDGNGCIDVGDVQAVFSSWGETTLAASSSSESALEAAEGEAFFTVNSAGNDDDRNTDDGVCETASNTCTLRAALSQANRRPGPETITFNIRNPDGSCPALVTIVAPPGASGYRIEDRSGRIVLDGYTQCGASPNTRQIGGNAIIKIELKGNRTIDVNGLSIYSSNNVVRGLAIYNWDFQLKLLYGAANDNRIEGNFLGTDAANTFQYDTSSPFGEQHHEGVRIQGGGNGAARNIIGGATPDKRNIISGNRKDGLKIQGAGARDNRIIGNYIGLKQDGITPLRNYTDGVDFEYGVKYNWLGGTAAGEGNVISGNFSEGIEISHDPGTQYNSVVGNYFGLTADGTRAASYGNSESGLSFEDTVDSNYAYNNVISGNGTSGIFFFILGTNNEVYNNKIGVAANGQTPVPNGYQTSYAGQTPPYYERNGITIMGGSQRNKIHHNIIANHPGDGIVLKNTSDNVHNHFGETYYNTISQNSLYNNGDPTVSTSGPIDGIWIKPYYYNNTWTYPNQGLPAPTISSATTTSVRGTSRLRSSQACAGCTIEVFIADKTSVNDASGDNAGEGKTFIGSGTTDANGNFAVAVSGVASGQIVTATATDTLGNTSQFSTNVAVDGTPPSDTTPPAVSISAPSSGATVSGAAVNIAANASDNVGVVGVQFKLDGANLSAEDTTAPYAITWDSTTTSNGTHTLTAVARDAAGNSTTSASVSVTVSNTTADTTITKNSVADAHVQADDTATTTNEAATNYGTAATMKADGSPVTHSFLRFDTGAFSGSVKSAKLRLCFTDGSTAVGTGTISKITNNTWSETGITYNNRPTEPGTQVGSYSGTSTAAFTTGCKVFDLPANSISEPGVYSFRMSQTGGDGVVFASKENTTTANRPQLILTTGTAIGDTTAPTVSITAPAPAATISGSDVTVSANASDNVGVVGVQFKLDGTNLGAEDTTAPYAITWDSTTTSNGTHTLTAVARDAAGNSTTSASVSVTVSNTTAGTTITKNPIADAQVVADDPATTTNEANQNYGTLATFGVDAAPVLQSFLRFDTGTFTGTVSSAKLRLCASSNGTAGNTSGTSGTLRKITNTIWSETGVTYNTRPALDGTVVGSYNAIAAGACVEFVLPAGTVTGPGVYNFAISQTSTDSVVFASREATTAASRPQLILTIQ